METHSTQRDRVQASALDLPIADLDIGMMLRLVWEGRWLAIATTVLFAAGGLGYSLLAQDWYRADVVLAPAGRKAMPAGLGQLGGLASLAGIDFPSAQSGEPLAVLRSKSIIREFIADKDLLPILFAKGWDPATHAWKKGSKEGPDLRDGVKYFDEHVRGVTEDKKSGLVTLTIHWTDPVVAAEWGNTLVKRINERLRAQAIAEAQSSIGYLQQELAAATVVSLQQSIGRVLEGEMQKMALARATEQFAFTVVDAATPPKYHESPLRARICVMATLFGAGLGAVLALLRASYRNRRESKRS